jgi:hypothetical protein
MAAKDPAAVAAKWAQNLSAATTSITAGVNAVTTAPGQLAAAQSAVWLARLQASQAKWERGVSAVTLAEWKNAMLNKGIPRIATGAQAAIPVMQRFMTAWLPYEAAGVNSLPPRGTVQQNIQRAVAMMNYNAAFVSNT